MIDSILWFLAGWFSCSLTVAFTRTFQTYRKHRSSLESIYDELSTIDELVNSKLDSAEAEVFDSFDMILPDDGYREVVGKGMNVYLSKNSAQSLGEVYSMVGLVNQVFEKSEPADPYKLYEIVDKLADSVDDALMLVRMEMEEGVYSSYMNFLMFHAPF